ncbi:MAG TPA: ATP-binding protein [Candidatus Limnocylindria bacterium]|nr:ATP-binding protein [Candidatus Limnocylindria bacterium]
MTDADGWTGSSSDLHEVLRSAGDGVTVQAPDGALVYANDAAARQMGFSSPAELTAAPIAEILGRYELIGKDGRVLTLDDLPGRRALQGEPEDEVVVGFRIDGRPEIRWSLVQATPVLKDGVVRFVVNVFHDITDLKRTEGQLRALAETGAVLTASDDYAAALQSLAEASVPILADWCVVDVFEVDGVRRVAVAHPDAEKRALAEELESRYPPDPERGPVADAMRTRQAQLVPEIKDEMLSRAAVDDEHASLLRSLGLGSAAILPLIARGQVLGALSLVRSRAGAPYSAEELPFLEELARRAALALDNARLLRDAQDSIRLRDDFLAMASHDMRTPLGAILGNLELAQRKLARMEIPAESGLGRNLANAVRTTGSLARLVDELMDVTMLHSGQPLPLRLEDIDLTSMAHEVAGEHQRQTAAHRIRVEADGEVRGIWDQSRIQRVLNNLVENAVKYSPDGGEVTIRVCGDGTEATVSVEDHGIGIPAGELELVFSPYQRASNTTGLRGLGLGLAGARDLLRQVGGDLTVESEEGGGSTFTMRLPVS